MKLVAFECVGDLAFVTGGILQGHVNLWLEAGAEMVPEEVVFLGQA